MTRKLSGNPHQKKVLHQKKSESTKKETFITDLEIDIDEDSTLNDLYNILAASDDDMFDGIEKETMKMIRKELRVGMPRELGDWTTISVDGKEECVHCNCNRCNFDGKCMWVSTFQSLQFGRVPDNLKGGEGISWNTSILYGRRLFLQINIDIDVTK